MYENKDRLSEKSPKITTLLLSTSRKIIKNRRMLYHQLLFAIINFNCMNVRETRRPIPMEKPHFPRVKPSGNMVLLWGTNLHISPTLMQ